MANSSLYFPKRKWSALSLCCVSYCSRKKVLSYELTKENAFQPKDKSSYCDGEDHQSLCSPQSSLSGVISLP